QSRVGIAQIRPGNQLLETVGIQTADRGFGRIEIAGLRESLRSLKSMITIDDRPFGDEHRLVTVQQPQPLVVVLRVVQSLVEVTNLRPRFAVDADRDSADVVPVQKREDLMLRRGERAPQSPALADARGIPEEGEIGEEELALRMARDPFPVDRELA